MIGMLHGKVLEKNPGSVIVDAGGVGYEVHVTVGDLAELPAVGELVRLRTHLEVKEDALDLYGFLTRDALDMFRLLMSVSQIGPRTALGVLSVLDVPALTSAIAAEDVKRLSTAPGIGKKTAQRILLDLGDKVRKRFGAAAGPGARSGAVPPPVAGVWELARDALEAQGFKPLEVEERLAWARRECGDGATIQQIMREALRFVR